MAPSAQPFLSFLWALYGFVHPTAYTDWKAPHETSHEYEAMSSPSCNSAACPAMDISFIWFIYPAYIPYNINHRNHIETMSKPKSPICIYVCVYIYILYIYIHIHRKFPNAPRRLASSGYHIIPIYKQTELVAWHRKTKSLLGVSCILAPGMLGIRMLK